MIEVSITKVKNMYKFIGSRIKKAIHMNTKKEMVQSSKNKQ